MGTYLNPRCDNFKESLAGAIFVDKSTLIGKVNEVIGTRQKYICISRPRRFGKTMALEMLAAYYTKGKTTKDLFQHLKVANLPSFPKYLNQFDVLKLNMQDFLSDTGNVDKMIERIRTYLTKELMAYHPDLPYLDTANLVQVMKDIYEYTGEKFVILIDEWDCLFREYKEDTKAQEKYLDFLRGWLKDQSYVALAYMTGILPIKKYGTHSALNMFMEYSMLEPEPFEQDFGFTEAEVESLCQQFGVSLEEMRAWYNGYSLNEDTPIYNPTSVTYSLLRKSFRNYWSKTETYEALQAYINLNYQGLRDKIVQMLAGDSVKINPDKFRNDMNTFGSADEVLVLLLHLGYVSYAPSQGTIRIPNHEVRKEFITAIEELESWSPVVKSIQASENVLQAMWNQQNEEVAKLIQEAHQQHVSILQYNDENALSYVVSLALLTAHNYYTVIRELPSGKGFTDLVFIPRQTFEHLPAMIIELKWGKSASEALAQIKERDYTQALKHYRGEVLLVGINYDRKSKDHECLIEEL